MYIFLSFRMNLIFFFWNKQNKFSEFGKITSHVAQYSEKNGAWFAYVAFEDTKSAEDAIANLHNKPVFGK